MKNILVLALVASLIGAFGAFVLPRAASTELRQAAPSDRTSVVLASARPGDDETRCPWKRERGTQTTVQLYRGA